MSKKPPFSFTWTPSMSTWVNTSSPPRSRTIVGPPGPAASSRKAPGTSRSASAAVVTRSRRRIEEGSMVNAKPTRSARTGSLLAVTTSGASGTGTVSWLVGRVWARSDDGRASRKRAHAGRIMSRPGRGSGSVAPAVASGGRAESCNVTSWENGSTSGWLAGARRSCARSTTSAAA